MMTEEQAKELAVVAARHAQGEISDEELHSECDRLGFEGNISVKEVPKPDWLE